nr:MAG TPA: hypothetical protein [Caudoviricetes sp.]
MLERCGCLVDTSAKQKHRPNRQMRIAGDSLLPPNL